MIRRVKDKNLSKVKGGKGRPDSCTCNKICACDGSIPGDNEASFEEPSRLTARITVGAQG